MTDLYVLALLYKNDQILLLRRINTNFGQGLYSLVGGKVETDERALHAIRREVLEEIGLDIAETDFDLVHTFHRKGTEKPLVALCFKANIANMPAPHNAEPKKHDDLRFFNINELPANILPAHKQAIEYICKNIPYSEHGW